MMTLDILPAVGRAGDQDEGRVKIDPAYFLTSSNPHILTSSHPYILKSDGSEVHRDPDPHDPRRDEQLRIQIGGADGVVQSEDRVGIRHVVDVELRRDPARAELEGPRKAQIDDGHDRIQLRY